MRYWYRCVLIALACGLLLSGAARAEENNSEVSDSVSVNDGPSRAEIFEARIRAELGLLGALSAAAAPPFILPTHAKDGTILGIDVSHHNDENCKCKPGQACNECKIDWSRIRDQKVSFAYVKASQGTKYRDPTFDYHWRVLAEKNIPRGAYHFMSADEDPIVQADNFLGKMEQDGKLQSIDLPPCLDLESDMRKDNSKRWLVIPDTGEIRDFWIGQDPDEIVQKVLKWLKRVEEKTGRVPIIYTSRGWWADRIKDEKKFAQLSRYPIWIANYTSSGNPQNAQPKVPNGQTWALWQFTETGRMKDSDALPGKMDVNLFNGSLGNFNQALGVTVPEKKEVVAIDTPKETTKPSEPVTGTNPAESKDTGKPSEQTVEVKPSEPTDANKPSEPVVTAKPSEPTDANKPSEPVVTAKPSEPTDANKPSEPVVTAKPSEPTDANKPSEPIVTAKPSEPTNTNKPSEPVVTEKPSEPTDANKPSEPVVTAKPSEPTDANKPSEPVVIAKPSEPTNTSKPSEPAVIAKPSEPTNTGKPSEPVVIAKPSEPTNTSKPSEPVVIAKPSEPTEVSKPAEQQSTGSVPTDAKQSTAPSSPRSRSRSRAAQNSASQNPAPPSAATQVASVKRSIVEIVLVNGRVLRVDASIDPAVLTRLLSAVESD